MIVSGFINIVKNYLTDSNEQVLLNIQEKIEHSLHSLNITKDNRMVYNKQEGKSIVSIVEEIQHIIMNNFKSDRTKNQVFIHFKSINDLFFKNLEHLLNYIVNVVSSSKPDALQLLVGINKLMEPGIKKEAEERFTIIGALRHFLLSTETARRKRIRRTVKFKSSRVYSIKWKSQEEMVIPPNTYATNTMEFLCIYTRMAKIDGIV
uniref:Uncharacterized protein n=1 Tax=Acrobeloides nanus TaxID=290746 RepID=A0A914CYV8_9BILA